MAENTEPSNQKSQQSLLSRRKFIKLIGLAAGSLSLSSLGMAKWFKITKNPSKNKKLETADSINQITKPSNKDRIYIGNIGTTVVYNANKNKFEIEGRATTDGSGSDALPDPDQFTTGSTIKTRGDGKTWEVA